MICEKVLDWRNKSLENIYQNNQMLSATDSDSFN